MLFRPETYFRHFPVAPEFDAWGLSVTATGYAQVGAQAPYPPATHPEDHLIDWSHGRVIDGYQLVLITAGRGVFQSEATGRKRLEEGSAFLLLPGVRHSYWPDPATGWEESWMEFRGPTAESLRARGFFAPDEAVRPGAGETGLRDALAAVHARVFQEVPGFDPELVVRAMGVISAWVTGNAAPMPDRLAASVLHAERYLAAHLAEPVNMEDLARDLGVAYSQFRRAFKERTGFSPWQYVVQLRLMRARRLLSESNATLEDVAAGLGFNSAFHLSTCFKQAFGVSPSQWRKPFSTWGG
jgi:AraC-like DNA-binding protein